MPNFQRAWPIQHEPFVNQGGRIIAESREGLSPEPARELQNRFDAGEFRVAIDRIESDVEDPDRNIITEPNRTYRVISNGREHYLIQTA